jgi:hypothetical protein
MVIGYVVQRLSPFSASDGLAITAPRLVPGFFVLTRQIGVGHAGEDF